MAACRAWRVAPSSVAVATSWSSAACSRAMAWLYFSVAVVAPPIHSTSELSPLSRVASTSTTIWIWAFTTSNIAPRALPRNSRSGAVSSQRSPRVSIMEVRKLRALASRGCSASPTFW